MNDSKESSVRFSLGELMRLEDERIAEEEANRRLRDELLAQQALAADRQRREQAEARQREEDARARAEAARVREEATRLQAIHDAEIERARHEAQSAARIEELRIQQEHERHVGAQRQEVRVRRLSFVAAVGAVLVLGGVTGEWICVARQANESAAMLARERQVAIEQSGAYDKMRAALQAQREQLALLERSPCDSLGRPPCSAGSGRVETPEPKGPTPPRSGTTRRPTATTATATTGCAHSLDPLCGQLP